MMFGGRLSALAVLAAALYWPAAASATTVTMGDSATLPANLVGIATIGCTSCGLGITFSQPFSPAPDIDFAPAAGKVTSWRVTGSGTLELRVIESGPEGGWVGVGTSAAATNLEGQPNATSLAIGRGDMIGVDFPAGSPSSVIGYDEVPLAEVFEWAPRLKDGGEFEEPKFGSADKNHRFLLSAEVVLAPVVSSLSSASGSTTGGNGVTITGKYLDGATGVTFGSTPASSFSVDSSSQITAIAPPSTASTVDVRVTGPGGASQVGAGDSYTSTPPATTTSTLPATTTSTTLTGSSQLGGVSARPAASGFSESASRWRRGSALPHISSAGKPPLGTTFSFTLNEPAAVSLSFTQRVPGRRVNGRCVAVGQRNAGKPKCKRTVSVGSLGLAGHAGLDNVRFQGRLSSAKTLKPGSYTVTITARDSHGLASLPHSLSFTIIPG
jgi:IPT/TIG domain